MTFPGPSMRTRRSGPPDGDPLVFISDEQSDHDVDVASLARLADLVLLNEGVSGDCELSIYFVEEKVMADLNVRHMGGDGPTDVLAFPLEEVIEGGRTPDTGSSGPDRPPLDQSSLPLLLGDVVVCPAYAARNAPEHSGPNHGGTLEDELALLVVHGILHVLGMDHVEPEETEAMQKRESELLEKFRESNTPSPDLSSGGQF